MKFLLFLIFFGYHQVVFSQATLKVKDNYDIFGKIYSEVTEDVLELIPSSVTSLQLIVNGDRNNWIVENLLRENISKYRNNLRFDSININNILEISHDSKMIYQNHQSNNDEFIRILKCNVLVRLNALGLIKTKNIVRTYQDSLEYSALSQIENNRIDVIKVFKSERNILAVLFEPLVVLAGFGTFVYLLFTIRSNQ